MAVTRWDPWGELTALQRDLEEALGWGRRRRGVRGAGILPLMDAFRIDEGTCVRIELPGMRPDDIEVSVEEGMLTVRGERRTEEEVTEEGWLRRERATGMFERTMSLPEGVDPEGIRASFEGGVLELVVPHPPERQTHRVPISGGQTGEEAIDVESQSRPRGEGERQPTGGEMESGGRGEGQ